MMKIMKIIKRVREIKGKKRRVRSKRKNLKHNLSAIYARNNSRQGIPYLII